MNSGAMSSRPALRPLLRCRSIALLFAAVCGLARGAETLMQPDLSVEGTALVLKLPDGRVMTGVELQGAIVHAVLDDGSVSAIKLTSIHPDPDDPDVLRHDFQAQDASGNWTSACAPTFDGETWGFPIALPEGHPGREGAITFTCASGAVGKCVRFGYKPWEPGPQGEDLLPFHAACVHMVRADYCGDGAPHTRNGTAIDVYDRIGLQKSEALDDAKFDFEAGWSSTGAVCVARTRWSDIATPDSLGTQCPQLPIGPKCTANTAAERGTLLFNRSRVRARIGN